MLGFLLFATVTLSVNALSIRNNPLGEEKIVGGLTVDIQDYPYQVAVIQNELLLCSGSVITVTDVLTAAHCVFYAVSPLSIHAGSSYWEKPGSVHQVINNVTYSSEANGDIALLQVDKPFVFDTTCQPIKLFAEGEAAPHGAFASLAGWGLTSDNGGEVLNQLSAVEVPLIDQETCNRDYEGTVIGSISPGQLCAGTDGKGPCRGDSGSPLVYKNRQLGLVTMGKGCASAEYPAIYTDVAYYSKWIIEHLSG